MKKQEGLVYVRGAFSLYGSYTYEHTEILLAKLFYSSYSVCGLSTRLQIREHSSPPAQFTSHVGKWCLGAADGSLQASR